MVIRKKGLEPHLLRGAQKQRGREVRHHIKAPSWLEEALAGRILSEGAHLCQVEVKNGWG